MPLLLHLWVERTGAASVSASRLGRPRRARPRARRARRRAPPYRPKLAKIGERIGAGTARNSARPARTRRAILRRATLSAVLGAIVILSAIVVGFAGNADVLEDRCCRSTPRRRRRRLADWLHLRARRARVRLRGRCSSLAAADAAAYPQTSPSYSRRACRTARARGRPTHPRRRAGRARERDGVGGGRVLVTLEAAHRRARVGPTQERRARHLLPPPPAEPSALPAESRGRRRREPDRDRYRTQCRVTSRGRSCFACCLSYTIL